MSRSFLSSAQSTKVFAVIGTLSANSWEEAGPGLTVGLDVKEHGEADPVADRGQQHLQSQGFYVFPFLWLVFFKF